MDGDFTIQSGYFDAPLLLWIEGELDDINAGLNYFNEGTGTVFFRGVGNSYIVTEERFYDLIVYKETVDPDSVIISSGKSEKVTNDLTVDRGTLKAEEGVNLYLDQELSVNNEGILLLHGIESNPIKVSSSSGYYDFTIESGGTLSASYCEFENMSSSGINIEDGAIIDPDGAFLGCTFKNGESGGSYLVLDNELDLTIIEPVFDMDIALRTYNIAKNTDQGSVLLLDASGSFAGDGYTHDPHNRIIWQNRAELFISSVIWSNTSPYGGDTLSCSVVVKNSGAGASSNCFLDIYLNGIHITCCTTNRRCLSYGYTHRTWR